MKTHVMHSPRPWRLVEEANGHIIYIYDANDVKVLICEDGAEDGGAALANAKLIVESINTIYNLYLIGKK
jgi:hypothetical protein